MTRPRALLILAAITAIGGGLRFYNLAWGAPYYHFHMDEHFVFVGADLLRQSTEAAAFSPKFFMYSPLPMHLVNVVRAIYEHASHPLALNVPRDEIIYMVMGRAISAAFGTATIPILYLVGARIAGRLAGLLAAAYLSVATLHVRDSHFFSVDISMTFFCMLTWVGLLHMADRDSIRSGISTGLSFAGGLLCKYSAAFMAVPIALAHLLSPARPRSAKPLSAWGRWVLLGLVPLITCVVTFLALDPLVIWYFDKFRDDVRSQITNPLTGATQPIFFAHFFDSSNPRLYWFTNLLWWGLGPALEIWSIAGVVWLLTRRNTFALLGAAVPLAYFAIAGNSVAPFVRYAIPLAVSLAVAAGVLSADLLRHSRWRRAGMIATVLVLGSTAVYTAAYMNVFIQTDSRVEAARYLRQTLPYGAKVLVEPSHNIPPMGSYMGATDFYRDYVMWGAEAERDDGFHLFALDTYRFLYDMNRTDAAKRDYIRSRLAAVDWIVMDDTYVQWYDHLPEPEHAVVKQHYDELFAGQLGFDLVKTFKVYPSLFGWVINDDNAELTFRLFDHPRVFVFKRRTL